MVPDNTSSSHCKNSLADCVNLNKCDNYSIILNND